MTANGPTVVVAWGGHIASVLDGGQGNTFKSGTTGYQMRLTAGGDETLSLDADAIAGTPSFTTQAAPTTVTTEQTVIDTATLTGTQAQGNVAGQVQCFVCGPASSAAPKCSQGGTPVGSGPNGPRSARARGLVRISPTTRRRRLWRDSGRLDHPRTGRLGHLHDHERAARSSRRLLDGGRGLRSPSDPGHFEILSCGDTTDPIELAPGDHTVSEASGVRTSRSDYTYDPAPTWSAREERTAPT